MQYRYKPASNSDNGFTGWTDVPGSNASTAFATVGRVRTGTPTFFQVRAVNSSNVLVGTVLGDAPAAHWPTPWTAISDSDASTTSHTVASLTAGTAYAFRILAVNPAGAGLPSGVASATPLDPRPLAPTSLELSSGDTSAIMVWTRGRADLSITRYEYRYKTAGDYPPLGRPYPAAIGTPSTTESPA